MGRSKEAIEYYRMISSKGRNYRDVTMRLDQLQPSDPLESEAVVEPNTWLQSLVRSCSQLLRNPG